MGCLTPFNYPPQLRNMGAGKDRWSSLPSNRCCRRQRQERSIGGFDKAWGSESSQGCSALASDASQRVAVVAMISNAACVILPFPSREAHNALMVSRKRSKITVFHLPRDPLLDELLAIPPPNERAQHYQTMRVNEVQLHPYKGPPLCYLPTARVFNVDANSRENHCGLKSKCRIYHRQRHVKNLATHTRNTCTGFDLLQP